MSYSLLAAPGARRSFAVVAKEKDALSKGIVKLLKEIQQLQKVCPLPAGIQAYIENGQIQLLDCK